MFLQAIAVARASLKIVTPYFLPEDRLITALSLAAMRGVAVDVVIPAESDHAFIDWATRAHIEPLLAVGGKLWRTPKPFEHSKLLTIDGRWSLIGSANWDARSMRLNFEINLEIYGQHRRRQGRSACWSGGWAGQQRALSAASYSSYSAGGVYIGQDFGSLNGENGGTASLPMDAKGNLYVTDPVNSVVRKISTEGQVSTLVGRAGQRGFLGGDLPGIIHTPIGIAVRDSKLYLATRNAVTQVNLPK